jgi:hypothetical protein
MTLVKYVVLSDLLVLLVQPVLPVLPEQLVLLVPKDPLALLEQ